MMKICVLGGGSWGSTIASHLAKKGNSIVLWEFVKAQAQQMQQTRTLSFLPQLTIPESVCITPDLKQALKEAEIIFSVVPSQFVRSSWKEVKKNVDPKTQWVVSLSKGIEPHSLKLMSEVIEEECPQFKKQVVVLSGPSHAEEVAQGIPTAIVAASRIKDLALKTQRVLNDPVFRVYIQPDIVGVQLCGSLKNVFAIACGACDGLGLGDNTKAALMTRGLNEMLQIGTKMGAQKGTFFGLAGVGDLIVTCSSKHSRNRLLGEKIGQGKTVQQALKELTMVAEGYPTSQSAYQLIEKYKCDCPILKEIYKVLFEQKNIQQGMQDLLSRPVHEEMEDMVWHE